MSLLYFVSYVFCFCICFILLFRSPVFLTGSQTKESRIDKGKEPETIPEIMKNVPEKIGGTTSTELGSPITSLTPLQSTFETPHEGVLYVSDLEPISRDEIPPSD
jgi:hypothetical protein